MVASWASSRGQIGLTGGPACGGGGGGAPGDICASAGEASTTLPSSTAETRILLGRSTFNFSGITGQQEKSRNPQEPRLLPIAASGGSVTSFPRRRCGGNISAGR